MNPRIQEIANKIDAMTMRERVLLMVAIVTVIFVIWDNLFLRSLEKERKQINSQITAINKQVNEVDTQIQKVVGMFAVDPDKNTRAEVSILKDDLKSIDSKLKELTLGLIPPSKMANVLQDVLATKASLKLISIKSLPAQPLLVEDKEEAKETKKAGSAGVYKHGLEIRIEGGYLATLDYLRALEGLPWKLYWDRVDFKVVDYPKAKATIVVHTLSLTEGWIGV